MKHNVWLGIQALIQTNSIPAWANQEKREENTEDENILKHVTYCGNNFFKAKNTFKIKREQMNTFHHGHSQHQRRMWFVPPSSLHKCQGMVDCLAQETSSDRD